MSSKANSSAETLFLNMASTKTTKKSKGNPNPPSPFKEKLFDSIADALIDDINTGSQNSSAFDQFVRVTIPEKSTFTQNVTTTTTTTMSTVTTVMQKTQVIIPDNKNPAHDVRLDEKKGTSRTIKSKYKTHGSIFTLDDISAIAALEYLVDSFGKVSHMGILDKSYSFFVTKSRDGALYFKVKDKVAVVGGDPLCEPGNYDNVMVEFAKYREQFAWDIAFLGATTEFAVYAQSKNWATMQFGLERVLNPMTNPLLLETGGGKRTISQSKQLLKNKITLGVYIPKQGCDTVLQDQLTHIYECWCCARNQTPSVQAYLTVYDPFAMPDLMTYIYAKDVEGKPCGFGALRKIMNGYHIDPCIALPGSARGISELLILSSMALLRKAGISYLSLGFEPSLELGEITGMSKLVQKLTRSVHFRTYRGLPIGGKRDFHDKFYPDEAQENDLYLVFPENPGIRHMKAMMHTVNISISKLLYEDMKRSLPGKGEELEKDTNSAKKRFGGQ